jgi:hypothetical protein
MGPTDFATIAVGRLLVTALFFATRNIPALPRFATTVPNPAWRRFTGVRRLTIDEKGHAALGADALGPL